MTMCIHDSPSQSRTRFPVRWAVLILFTLAIAVTSLQGGGHATADGETPVATETASPTPTETPTPEPTATETPEPTATPTDEPTFGAQELPTETPTPEPTATETPLPTETPTPEPTATETPVPTATPTSTPVPTPAAAVSSYSFVPSPAEFSATSQIVTGTVIVEITAPPSVSGWTVSVTHSWVERGGTALPEGTVPFRVTAIGAPVATSGDGEATAASLSLPVVVNGTVNLVDIAAHETTSVFTVEISVSYTLPAYARPGNYTFEFDLGIS